MDSGFGEEDTYNVYDKPWRQDQTIASNIYRPSKNIDKEFGDDLNTLMKSNRSVYKFVHTQFSFKLTFCDQSPSVVVLNGKYVHKLNDLQHNMIQRSSSSNYLLS